MRLGRCRVLVGSFLLLRGFYGKRGVTYAVKIKFIFKQLMHNICWGAVLRNPKLGELSCAGIAARVGRGVVDSPVRAVAASFVSWMVTERFDQLVGVNVLCERHCAGGVVPGTDGGMGNWL